MTKTNTNLKLWEAVAKTDPKYTKKVTLGNRSFTTVCAQYQIRNATEVFGPYGVHWRVEDEKFNVLCNNELLAYTATLKYALPGNEGAGSIPLHAGARLLDSKGKPDSDAFKKVATDALTKGLSKLGFNADVFLGQFDDNKYVQRMLQEHATGNPEEPEASKAPASSVKPADANRAELPSTLPKPTTEEAKCMNRLWKWAEQTLPKGITSAEFAKLVYACFARWPNTPLDEQHIKTTLTIDKAEAAA